MHIYRGRQINQDELETYIPRLEKQLCEDLSKGSLNINMVITAVDKLVKKLDMAALKERLKMMDISDWKAEDLLMTIKKGMTKEALYKKIERELGPMHERWQEIEPGVYQRRQAYGVLMHIGAGNVVALSVISIIEGLLAGNINILKLPSYEGGISIELLQQLIDIEPRLAPYIYVFDVSSSDIKTIEALSKVSDAVIVWGSDEAILGIRQIAPPNLPIIEWGHKLSFAYLQITDKIEMVLEGLAEEICLSDQNYCSSPQCIFIEEATPEILKEFGERLAIIIETMSQKYPQAKLQINAQAEITWTKEMVKMEAILGHQYLIESPSKSYNIFIDYETKLKASPQYRNIWLMPIKRNQIMSMLRTNKGHLQTVGLHCNKQDYEELSDIFYRAGVNRVTDVDLMSRTYVGEPHDGKETLKQYTRVVSRRKMS